MILFGFDLFSLLFAPFLNNSVFIVDFTYYPVCKQDGTATTDCLEEGSCRCLSDWRCRLHGLVNKGIKGRYSFVHDVYKRQRLKCSTP